MLTGQLEILIFMKTTITLWQRQRPQLKSVTYFGSLFMST